MKEKEKRRKTGSGAALIVSIILTFCVLGTVVYAVSTKISAEMSASAVSNLTESLELLKGTIEAILKREAEFQKLTAREIAETEDPEAFIKCYNGNSSMVKISLIPSGEKKGISNTGEEFSEEGLDFSAKKTVNGLPVSGSYVNGMGTWAYTMKCPVVKDQTEIGTLYIEYIYDSFGDVLPERFYNGSATLYIMDAKSERVVLKPEGLNERLLGHLNLEDFYHANKILEDKVQDEIAAGIQAGEDVMFYHDIQNKSSLIYLWSVNDGSIYLIGFVPIEAVQREGDAVNQSILIVVIVMLAAFLICCVIYYSNRRQQEKVRKEREAERDLHNKQLAEALQAAQLASSSKTTFLSNMSHDIRTPMNAILGFTTLLTKDAEDPMKVREYTKKITASGRHLLSLINDVLDVSKIESGKVVLTIGEFTLNDMVSAVDAIIRPMAREKGQEFEVSVTNVRHERLLGDETRINQILINLLSNAVKYTQDGGKISLRIIGLERRSSQYEHIRIEVEDNGYGMTPEYLEVIFDAFTRAENSTTNKVQGTGLGMAITKNIVELMGGHIEVSSEVDKGSLFTVELELRIPEDETMDQRFWREHGVLRILAADDDEEVCQNIQMLMEAPGVITEVSHSGEEAVRLIREACEQGRGYDAVLLGWKMPGMDGIETARQIRKICQKHIPIFLLTAYDWEEIQQEAADAGIDGFLAKPFFVSAFKEKILGFFAEKQDMQEADAENEAESCLNGRHFLIVEDNEINSEILLELLHVDGADGTVAENGKQAVECFQNSKAETFDAILMDVQMPVMNGYDATRAIRALDREDAKTIPIIAMTANAFAEDVRDAKDAGMNDHIAKPVEMEIIRTKLSKYLKKREGQ